MSGVDAFAINTAAHTADTSKLLLDHYLKELGLSIMQSAYDKVAWQCAIEQVDSSHAWYVNPQINVADAFVEAGLLGVGRRRRRRRADRRQHFSGKLSFS
jgi:hypothetical protein